MLDVRVIGAGRGLGASVVRALAARGIEGVAIARTAVPPGGRYADARDPGSLKAALKDARIVVSCINACFTKAILASLPSGTERLVITGSTRVHTRFPDRAGDDVREAERAVLGGSVPAVVIHPTMIYGAEGGNNVQRVARIIRKLGVVPLPAGGASLVQPIHLDDVAHCLAAACTAPEAVGRAIVVAGPQALTYKDFIRAIADSIGRPVRIVAAPPALLKLAARATRIFPGLPSVTAAEIDRLLEDKVFPIDDMVRILKVAPRTLEAGLSETFPRPATKPDAGAATSPACAPPAAA